MMSSVSREKEQRGMSLGGQSGGPLWGGDIWAEPRMKWGWAMWICGSQVFQAEAPTRSALGNEDFSEGAMRSRGVRLYQASKAQVRTLPPRPCEIGRHWGALSRSDLCFNKIPLLGCWKKSQKGAGQDSNVGGVRSRQTSDMFWKLGRCDELMHGIWGKRIRKEPGMPPQFRAWAAGRMELPIPEIGNCGSSRWGEGRQGSAARLAMLKFEGLLDVQVRGREGFRRKWSNVSDDRRGQGRWGLRTNN